MPNAKLQTSRDATALYLASCLTKPGGVDLMGDEARAEAIAQGIEPLLFSDEKKAELYARLADKLTADTTYADAVRIIEHELWRVTQ